MFGQHHTQPRTAEDVLGELLERARPLEYVVRASIDAPAGPERMERLEALERAVEVFSWDVGEARARLRELEQGPAQSAV